MKNLIILALALTSTYSAYSSEKGGNRLNRSQELKVTLEIFQQTNMCSSPFDSKFSTQAVCRELENEIMEDSGDSLAEEFFSQCCNK